MRAEPKRILVINTFGIGDMVMATPLLRCLRRAWPSAEVTLLVKAFGAERVIAGGALVDKVLVYRAKDERLLREGTRLLHRLLAAPGSDVCVVTSGKNPLLAGVASLAARARWRVGEDIGGKGRFYTHRVPFQPRLHTVRANLRLAAALGLETADHDLFFAVSEAERAFATRFLQHRGLLGRRRLLAVQIGCNPAFSQKRWPVGHWTRLCDMIQRRGIGIPVLLGSRDERQLATQVKATAALPVHSAVGVTTLGEAAALVEHSTAVVGGDGGLLHVAAAVGTPTVAVFGPSDPHRNRPWGNGHRVVSAGLACSPCYPRLRHGCDTPRCMEAVDPEVVMEALEHVVG
jgi:lipopolysaccharide heptosyltransferase II